MRQIRKGVFETNSSSTHSITICTQKEFNEFKSGLLVLDWKNTLIPASQKTMIAKPMMNGRTGS